MTAKSSEPAAALIDIAGLRAHSADVIDGEASPLVVLARKKRRRRWPDPARPKGSWTEEREEIAPRSGPICRASIACYRTAGENGRLLSFVARRFGVSLATVLGAVVAQAKPKVDNQSRIGEAHHLGIDEMTWPAATPDYPTIFATFLVNTKLAEP